MIGFRLSALVSSLLALWIYLEWGIVPVGNIVWAITLLVAADVIDRTVRR